MLDLTQLCDICVQEEKVRYLGRGYVLMLRLAAGFSYPLTQSATLGGPRFVFSGELLQHMKVLILIHIHHLSPKIAFPVCSASLS